MVALWGYPWTLAEEGLANTWKIFDAAGVDALNFASHYHSVRSMQPRSPENLFVQYPGGCYFNPDPERFDEVAIDPPINRVPPFSDPLQEVVVSAEEHGIDVNGWTVLFHNSRLGAANPRYRVESAFGDPQDHAFCPSHPEVRDYFAAIVAAIADRGVTEVQLESLGYQTVFHGHGANFGHDKRQVLTSHTEEVLLSQCFCDGCQEAAGTHLVDIDRAREVTRDLLLDAFSNPQLDLPSIDTLVAERPVLNDLIDFRSMIISEVCERLSHAASGTPINYYIMDGAETDVGTLWPAGVRLSELQDHLDRVTMICYVRDPDVAWQRIYAIQRTVDTPVDVGITLDQTTLRTREELESLVDAVRQVADGNIHVYHYSLMTDAHVDWLRAVF